MFRTRLIRGLTVAAVLQLMVAGALMAGTVSGTIKYEGAVPKLKPVQMGADPGCAAKHSTPPQSELLVLGEGNTMGNIFVRVKSGLPSKKYPAPSEAAVLDQEGCRYDPHVLGVMVGQKLRILNSDGLMHNVHALPEINKQFNMAMPKSRTEAIHTFTKAEGMFKIKCDVHPWMGAWVAVVPHPFFDVTGVDGKYTISNLPAGTYEIEIWHERLEKQTQKVTVGDSDTTTLDFTMIRPSK
jgi:plastocyanin